MATTADGKIATAGREVTTFGSTRDLDGLYRLRAGADAILCGARTVEETGATLGTGGDRYERLRRSAGLRTWPIRVVVSGRGSLSSEAEIWSEKRSPLVILTRGDVTPAKRAALENRGAEIWSSPDGNLDLASALVWLMESHGVRRVVCEGGGTLNAAMFRCDLVDELRLTLCPRVFGGRPSPTIADGVPGALDEAAVWSTPVFRKVGDEIFGVWRRRHGKR